MAENQSVMDNTSAMANRDRIIVRTSVTGILVNVLLAAFKAAAGLASHSIAVILDAVNNLSDALSSVITIIGTKLANRLPDRKHPLGHGRAEYLSAMLVSAIVLYAGITSLIESVKKVFSPAEDLSYSYISLVILAVAIAAKLLLGRFVKSQGKKVHSGALEASGSDALFDALISLSVFVSAVIYLLGGPSLEAYVGIGISAMIIKAGVEMMLDNVSDVLGRRASQETTKAVKDILNAESEVRGAYDLVLNNYGPNKDYGSVHVELRDTMTVEEVDVLTRRLERAVYLKTGVILTGVGVYSYNTSNDEAARIRNDVQQRVLAYDWALQFHGFHINLDSREMRFDVVMSFDIPAKEGLSILYADIQAAYPDYAISITPDVDITD